MNEPDLIASLQSIENCDKPQRDVAVVVVVNAPENADESVKQKNLKIYAQCKEWAQTKRKFDYYFILENELPIKHAGVGLARKIGMDEAVRIFESNYTDGIILCFDADCSCEKNLLTEVGRLFLDDDSIPGCSIHFEHPLAGKLPDENYIGIVQYELHLRYYIDGLRYAGFPYAYQTIGSAMAVKGSIYQKQGGMNRRKAGEDFYFLHKIIPLENFKNLNTTTVFPSPRRSDRVPFGTGKAIGEWIDQSKNIFDTYHYQVFEDLTVFVGQIDRLYDRSVEDIFAYLPKSIQEFLTLDTLEKKVIECRQNSSNLLNFRKRFFQWFNGFKVLKYVHFARDHYYPNIPIQEGIAWLFDKYQIKVESHDLKEQLLALRKLNKDEVGFS